MRNALSTRRLHELRISCTKCDRSDSPNSARAGFGDEGKVLAGGHSLVPMMKLRLAEPAHLIDINAIAGLSGINEAGDAIVIGAGTTQAEVLASDLLAQKCQILPDTAALIVSVSFNASA